MDERAAGLHAAVMRPRHFCFLLLLLAGTAGAQQIALPAGTGHLTPGPGWTTLDAEALAAPSRPSDPSDEPAKALFQATLAALQQPERKGLHVLLHARGDTPGSLRLVNAYCARGAATSADLQSQAKRDEMRDTLLATLRTDGNEVRFDGADQPELFPVGSLRLRFTLTQGSAAHQLHYHVVPAGSFTQYFEAMLQPDDAGGEAAVAALLRTFDGAREGSSLPGMLIGGLAGALAGVLAGLWRRNRLQRGPATQRN